MPKAPRIRKIALYRKKDDRISWDDLEEHLRPKVDPKKLLFLARPRRSKSKGESSKKTQQVANLSPNTPVASPKRAGTQGHASNHPALSLPLSSIETAALLSPCTPSSTHSTPQPRLVRARSVSTVVDQPLSTPGASSSRQAAPFIHTRDCITPGSPCPSVKTEFRARSESTRAATLQPSRGPSAMPEYIVISDDEMEEDDIKPKVEHSDIDDFLASFDLLSTISSFHLQRAGLKTRDDLLRLKKLPEPRIMKFIVESCKVSPFDATCFLDALSGWQG